MFRVGSVPGEGFYPHKNFCVGYSWTFDEDGNVSYSGQFFELLFLAGLPLTETRSQGDNEVCAYDAKLLLRPIENAEDDHIERPEKVLRISCVKGPRECDVIDPGLIPEKGLLLLEFNNKLVTSRTNHLLVYSRQVHEESVRWEALEKYRKSQLGTFRTTGINYDQ